MCTVDLEKGGCALIIQEFKDVCLKSKRLAVCACYPTASGFGAFYPTAKDVRFTRKLVFYHRKHTVFSHLQ